MFCFGDGATSLTRKAWGPGLAGGPRAGVPCGKAVTVTMWTVMGARGPLSFSLHAGTVWRDCGLRVQRLRLVGSHSRFLGWPWARVTHRARHRVPPGGAPSCSLMVLILIESKPPSSAEDRNRPFLCCEFRLSCEGCGSPLRPSLRRQAWGGRRGSSFCAPVVQTRDKASSKVNRLSCF